MRVVAQIDAAELLPDRAAVLRRMDVPPDARLSTRMTRMLDASEALYRRFAAPRVVIGTLSRAEFAEVYGSARPASEPAPLEEIFPRADHLALFAATLGPAIDDAIAREFGDGNAAVGYALDVAASEAADRLADRTAGMFLSWLSERGRARASWRVLPYSPGYCGWPVDGQRNLFAWLDPAETGITLKDSCFMRPVKSVSGVLVVGDRTVHAFKPTFPLCDACVTHECRNRIASLRDSPGETR